MEHHLIQDVGIAIVGAMVVGLIANRLRIPLILAYLATGAGLGPHFGIKAITNPQSISTLSEIGLILLMFILGMEIDVKKLLQAGKAVLLNGLLQFLGCLFLGLGFYHLIGFIFPINKFEILYLAVATSLSSTLIVVKILSDKMELDTLTSRITLGILVIQDIWAIAFLAMQPNLNNIQFSILVLSAAKAGILVATGIFLARFLLPWVFEKASKTPELLMIVALGWCFGLCGLANYLGLSKEMGALMAGIAIASYPYHLQVALKIAGLRDFFITLFFLGLGLQIPVPNINILIISSAVLIFVYFSRFLTVLPVLLALRYGNRVAIIPCLNLAQVSEFSLVLTALGVQFGHIPKEMLSGLIIAFVITALFSSFVIPNSHAIFRKINPFFEFLGLRESLNPTNNQAHQEHSYDITFLGFFKEGSSLLFEIEQRFGKDYLNNINVIDYNPESLKNLKLQGVPCQYGDIGHLEALVHSGLEKSKIIACTIPDHILRGVSNLTLLRELKKIAPNAKIIVTAETLLSAQEMYSEGADYVFIPRIISSRHLADALEAIEKGQLSGIREKELEELSNRQEIVA